MRGDFEERDDTNWLCHSIYFPSDKRVAKRAVNLYPKPSMRLNPKCVLTKRGR